MDDKRFDRTELLIGSEAMARLRSAKVAIFGIGGVGGHATEVMARSGVGTITLFDGDVVSITNINRQIIATTSTIGRPKVEVMAERIADINPACSVQANSIFYNAENAECIDLKGYDYVVDCIDDINAKVELIRRCTTMGVNIISCMGAAFKMNPMAFRVADLAETCMDPIAKLLRKRLRPLGIEHVRVVYSEEVPHQHDETAGRHTPASNAFVPAAAGLLIGSEVVKSIALSEKNEER